MEKLEKYFATEKEIYNHNKEVKKIWEAYGNKKPIRVPALLKAIDTKVLIHADKKRSFISYYKDPEEMLKAQAEVQYLENRIILSDVEVGQPLKWSPSLDYWPFSDESYWPCEVVFMERQQPRVNHLYVNEKIDPDNIPLPDPFKDNIMDLIYTNYLKMKELIRKGYKFLGRPFHNEINVLGLYWTYGTFNTATQLRGDKIFLDLYEDPGYVKKLLNKVADGYITRSNAWIRIAREERKNREGQNGGSMLNPEERPVVYDHGIDMISEKHYEEFLVPVYDKISRAFGNQWDSFIEFCGHGERLPIYWHKKYGVNLFVHVNGSFVDIEKLRYEVGPDVELHISIHPEIVLNGPPERIRKAVKELLSPVVKGRGNLAYVYSDNPTAPMENIKALYEAVKEYGHY